VIDRNTQIHVCIFSTAHQNEASVVLTWLKDFHQQYYVHVIFHQQGVKLVPTQQDDIDNLVTPGKQKNH
jgi:hypothetical protein